LHIVISEGRSATGGTVILYHMAEGITSLTSAFIHVLIIEELLL